LRNRIPMHVTDLAYRIAGKAARTAYRALRWHPDSAPYVSGDAFRALADHVMDMDSEIDPGCVERGDVVFVETHGLPRFEAEILPRIGASFVLITHNSDLNIDGTRIRLANDRRIAKWFAQNVVCAHEKLVHLPIGLENRWRHNNGIIGDYRRLSRRPVAKLPRILYGFSVGTNSMEREPALAALRRAEAADECRWTNSKAYRRRLNEYCFVASPPGNGVDCHRTWEALYLGVVPIVKRSTLYDGFGGLPAIVVDDWREIEGLGESDLKGLYERTAIPPERIDSLWMEHWEAVIASASKEVRTDGEERI
jgi:hypothetical protein